MRGFNDRQQRVWDAAFAAAYVREHYDHAKEFGCASALEREVQLTEEAACVADIVVERFQALEAARRQ